MTEWDILPVHFLKTQEIIPCRVLLKSEHVDPDIRYLEADFGILLEPLLEHDNELPEGEWELYQGE